MGTTTTSSRSSATSNANALRAGLVPRAEAWPHGSLHSIASPPGPVPLEPVDGARDATWVERVNAPMSEAELAAMCHCVARSTPFGTPEWATRTAVALGLESTMRARGRPLKFTKK